ncbi:hypothetical protein ACFFF1_08350 [Listeria seeligeri]|uniref:hypothetical protein n=1 Tax=Listeria seeligeri TaxID=1640 RepID=UPI0011D14579|nr:hypothetical protein [Listeria seeligeri]
MINVINPFEKAKEHDHSDLIKKSIEIRIQESVRIQESEAFERFSELGLMNFPETLEEFKRKVAADKEFREKMQVIFVKYIAGGMRNEK